MQVRRVERFVLLWILIYHKKRHDETSEIIGQIKNILSVKGRRRRPYFDVQSIYFEDIQRDAPYKKGMRILFQGTLDSAKINMQIDISFRDVIFPEQ